MKKIFRVLFAVLVLIIGGYLMLGYVLQQWEDYIKNSYEKSLFPRVAQVRSGNDAMCTPDFITVTDGQISLYCKSSLLDSEVREQLRSTVKSEMQLWANENDLQDRFVFVGFSDEVTLRPKK